MKTKIKNKDVPKVKIHVEITTDTGKTYLNYDNFDRLILAIINEREHFNFFERDKMFRLINNENNRY